MDTNLSSRVPDVSRATLGDLAGDTRPKPDEALFNSSI